MSILNILLCLGVVNLISPALGDINPAATYYNPVAAVVEHRSDQNQKSCPGALVWVKHWQVFIGSRNCLQAVGWKAGMVVRAGGNIQTTNDESAVRDMWHNSWNTPLGVGIIFVHSPDRQNESFPLTSLIIPGILQKDESDAKNELPITISRDTWGPHHEVAASWDGNNFYLIFNEPLKSRKCPEEVEWGPAMLPSRWSVPLIIGVFNSYNGTSRVKDGVCEVTLRYTSIIPAVDWIEKKISEIYQGWSIFAKQGGKTVANYLEHLKTTTEPQR